MGYFNGRIAAAAATVASLIYIILPEMEETRLDMVIAVFGLTFSIYVLLWWGAQELMGIQKKRESLSIVANRPDHGNRDSLPVDVKLRSRVIVIPAEKVV